MNVEKLALKNTEALEILTKPNRNLKSKAPRETFKLVMGNTASNRSDTATHDLADFISWDSDEDLNSTDEITMQIDDLVNNIDWDSDDDEIDNFLSDVNSGSNVQDDLAFLNEFDYE